MGPLNVPFTLYLALEPSWILLSGHIFAHFSLSIEAFLHMYIWETDLRYSSSFALQDQVQEGIQKQVGELEPVEQSDWATPIMVVKDKDGGLRTNKAYQHCINNNRPHHWGFIGCVCNISFPKAIVSDNRPHCYRSFKRETGYCITNHHITVLPPKG